MATINKSVKDLPQLPVELVEQLASFVKTEQDLSLITNQLMNSAPANDHKIFYIYVTKRTDITSLST